MAENWLETSPRRSRLSNEYETVPASLRIIVKPKRAAVPSKLVLVVTSDISGRFKTITDACNNSVEYSSFLPAVRRSGACRNRGPELRSLLSTHRWRERFQWTQPTTPVGAGKRCGGLRLFAAGQPAVSVPAGLALTIPREQTTSARKDGTARRARNRLARVMLRTIAIKRIV